MIKYSTVVISLLAASSVLSGCQDSNGQGHRSKPATEVGFVTVKATRFHLTTELQGRTVSSLVAQVRPQVSGIVEQRLFKEGADVTKGQVLYQIDPAVYQATYNQAKANLKSAEASLRTAKLKDDRYVNLVKSKGISQQDADDAHAVYMEAKANIDKYKAALSSAKIALGYTRITAPISGRIGISNVTPGALLTAEQSAPLATIIRLDPIYVDMTQNSAELLKLRDMLQRNGVKKGSAEVTLTLEDGSTYPLKGQLKMREVSVNESTGSVTLRAEFPNPDGILLPGMFVRARVNEAVDDHAILVPQQGIYHNTRGGAYAYLIGKDNTIVKRQVVTGRAEGSQWLISKGLHQGDKLLVEGSSKVAPGSKVKPVAVVLNGDGTSTVLSPAVQHRGGQ